MDELNLSQNIELISSTQRKSTLLILEAIDLLIRCAASNVSEIYGYRNQWRY
jgi:hypothetical protein